MHPGNLRIGQDRIVLPASAQHAAEHIVPDRIAARRPRRREQHNQRRARGHQSGARTAYRHCRTGRIHGSRTRGSRPASGTHRRTCDRSHQQTQHPERHIPLSGTHRVPRSIARRRQRPRSHDPVLRQPPGGAGHCPHTSRQSGRTDHRRQRTGQNQGFQPLAAARLRPVVAPHSSTIAQPPCRAKTDCSAPKRPKP